MRIIYLILILLIPFDAFAVTQYYYLRATGAGSNAGQSGAWAVRPTSDANSMSATQFSSVVNWSATENVNKMDPDDVVYVKGSGWSGPTLYVRGPITLDGWETGTFDPKEESTFETAPYLYEGTKIFVWSDDVTIRDLRFNKSNGWNIRVGVDGDSQFLSKIRNFTLTNNYFYCYGTTGTHVWMPFIVDSTISYNYSYATHVAYGLRKWISIGGGSRNLITHNDRVGPHAFYINQTRKPGYSKVPASGTDNYDRDYNWSYNEMSYNSTNRWTGIPTEPEPNNGDEEAFSLDVADGSQYGALYERDTVSSVNGLTITLTNTGYATASGGPKDYSGLMIMNITADADKYGKTAYINVMDQSNLTLSKTIGAEAGDIIQIGHTYYRNWIHNNYTDPGGEDRGFGTSTFLLEGPAAENLVENNTFTRNNTSLVGGKFSTNDGGRIAREFDLPTDAWNDPVTRPSLYGAVAYSIFRNNTTGMFDAGRWQRYPPEGLPVLNIKQYNNAFYDNTFTLTNAQGGGYRLHDIVCYLPSNERSAVSSARNVTYLATDPTTSISAWFEDWTSGATPPDTPVIPTDPGGESDTTPPEIEAATATESAIVVTFTENVDLDDDGSYETGDFTIQCVETGIQNVVWGGSAVAKDQDFTVATPIVAGEVCWLIWNGTADDIVDEAGNDLSASEILVYTGVPVGEDEDENDDVATGVIGSGANIVFKSGAKLVVQ